MRYDHSREIFDDIYLPGESRWVMVACTLPPGEEYDFATVMNASFDGWEFGDLVSLVTCTGPNCNYDTFDPIDFVLGGSIYEGGGSWTGDASIISGAGYIIITVNSGWCSWFS